MPNKITQPSAVTFDQVSIVKDNLPDIQVKIGRDTYTGQLSGRRCEYAKVFVKVVVSGQEITIDNEWSWEQVTAAYLDDRPLIWS